MEGIFFDQYQTFRCIGPDCPYTCCGGNWRIEIDEETDRFYRRCEGEFGAFLNQNILRDGGAHFRLDGAGNCAMLDGSGLCRIQTEYGAEHLCQTCRLFPRLETQRDGMIFFYLSLACPEAARAALSSPLLLLRRDVPSDAPDTEASLLRRTALLTAVNLLQDRACDIRQRQRLFLLLSQAVQTALDAGNADEARAVLAFFSRPSEYRALAAEDGGTDAASKVALLRKLGGLFLTERRERRLPELFRAAAEYLQSPRADFAAFAAALSRQEHENLLPALLPGKYVSAFANGNLYHQAVYVLTLSQLFRVFAAVDRAARVDARDAVLAAYIDRYFEHTEPEVKARFARLMVEQGLTDPGFLFRLVS
ncbi:MAG: flagellin lysine-N-methylase [Oscillospiraceae bacterium]|nr:flagellin lysine-N-methylase [Oscillospiraceae bacterium]